MLITKDWKDIESLSCGMFTEALKKHAEVTSVAGTAHGNFAFGGKALSTMTTRFGRSCHNDLRYMTKNTHWLVNYYGKNDREQAEEFMQYLMQGPYAKAVEDAVFYTEEGRVKYIGWKNVPEKDIKLLANFLIATRLISQFNAGRLWGYLQKNGFTPDTAFILLNCCSFKYDGDISTLLGAYGDMPLSPQVKYDPEAKYLDPDRIYKRNPRDGAKIKDGGNSYLSNYIWGGRETPLVILRKENEYGYTDGNGNTGIPYSKTMEKVKEFFNEKNPLPKDFAEPIEKKLRNGEQID